MLLNILGSGNLVGGLIVFLVVFAVLVFVISVHEFAHAWTSSKLGDPTAKSMGRVTLNPLSHLDPLGTLLIVLVGFGWGKPVPFDPSFFKNPRRDSALVSLAGPASNFLFAALFAALYQMFGTTSEIIQGILFLLVQMNLLLCFFNLIPVHPLDGFKVVWGILPQNLSYQWMDLAPYGIYILILMIFTNTTELLMGPPVEFFSRLFLG